MKKNLFLCLVLLIFSSTRGSTQSIDEIVHIIKNKQQYPNYMLVAAHRGYWADYPENSLGAYNMAINIKADIIEMDVRLTKDGELIVLHDACLDRVTTGYGLLSNEEWSYVKKLNLKLIDGTPTKLKALLLSKALDFLKSKAIVSIDIKETGDSFNKTMIDIINMLKGKGMLWQTIIKGRLPLDELQKNILIPAKVTLSDFIYTPIAFSDTKNLDSYIKNFINSEKIYAFELVYKQSADPILSYINLLKQKHIWIGQYSFWPETRHGVFAEKFPLTDTDPIARDYNFLDQDPKNFLDDGRGDWDWLLSKGANYIITDRSELMIDYLEIIGKRTK